MYSATIPTGLRPTHLKVKEKNIRENFGYFDKGNKRTIEAAPWERCANEEDINFFENRNDGNDIIEDAPKMPTKSKKN